jgi:hypothetical protein
MDILSESEIQEINSNPKLVKKYSELVDRESAYELLIKKNYTSRKRSCNKKRWNQKEKKATTKATKTAARQGQSTGEVVM